MHRSMVLVTLDCWLGASDGVVHCIALHGTALPHFHHLPQQQQLLLVLTEQQQQHHGTEQQQQEGMECLVSSSSSTDAAVSSSSTDGAYGWTVHSVACVARADVLQHLPPLRGVR